MKFLVTILIFCCSAAEATATDDLMNLSQEELRIELKSRIPTIASDKKESLKSDTGYFALLNKYARSLMGQKVLEIGCSSGASVRAFANAASISIVEPDIEALALGLSPEWTKQIDIEHLNLLSRLTDETFEAYANRMSVDISWICNINPVSSQWIPDATHIYPTILQHIPRNVDRSFDLVTYKDFNIPKDQWEIFFQRLSEVITLNGTAIIEFWTSEYADHNSVSHGDLAACIRKYFTMEHVIDTVGHKVTVSEDPLVLEDAPNDIRFILLQLKGR
jgi:hypothetical protein